VETFRKSVIREYFESIVIAVVMALFIRTFVVQAFKIPTGSMEPNLLVGDHLLVNKFAFAPGGAERAILPTREIRRGDVVVFKYPEDTERDFVKRVVGLPGETLELRNHLVYINGKPLDEPYAHFLPRPDGGSFSEMPGDVRDTYGPVMVPADAYFMMGDNRDNSQDSRYWGFLPHDLVKGRALFIYWSFEPDGGMTGVVTGTRWSRLLHQIH